MLPILFSPRTVIFLARKSDKVGRAITIERAIRKRSKEVIPKMKEIRLRVITLNGAIEKKNSIL